MKLSVIYLIGLISNLFKIKVNSDKYNKYKKKIKNCFSIIYTRKMISTESEGKPLV